MTEQIRELTKNEIKAIYDQWMIQHFPPEEIKPWKNISRMHDQGEYCGFAMLRPEEKLVSYALFAKAAEASRVLLDYFAVCEDYRSQGIGSRFLTRMQELLPGYRGILIETEDIACAQDEEERAIRKRRDTFYERAGARLLPLTTRIYGVQYRIWHYPFMEKVKEPWNGQEPEEIKERKETEDCRQDLREIYMKMIPGEKNRKNVQI